MTNIPTEIDLASIRTRDESWTANYAHMHRSDGYGQAAADRRALLGEIERLEREKEGWASVAATRNVNIALIAEERDRLRAALNLERQRLVSWADRLNKRGKNEAADEVWERVEAIDQAMSPAPDVGDGT